MARARNIKPGFFKNENLVELDPFDRLLFIGLWCLADREGRLENRPRRIKMELFPGDNYDAAQGIAALERLGFVETYEADGKSVVAVVNFLKHQAPHGTERDSELPDRHGDYTTHSRGAAGCVKKSTSSKNNDLGEKLTVNAPLSNVELPLDNVNPPLSNVELPLDNALIHRFSDSPNPDSDSLRSSCAPQGEAPEPKAKQKRASTIPADFEPNETCISLAAELGVPLGQELPKFRDHHSAKGTTMKDWQAAFRTWLRNAKQFARPSPRDSPAESRRQQQDDWLNQLIPGRQQKRHDDERTIESTPRLVG